MGRYSLIGRSRSCRRNNFCEGLLINCRKDANQAIGGSAFDAGTKNANELCTSGVPLFEHLQGLVYGKRVALIGVGNRDRGDDAFGSLLAERVESSVRLVSIDCEEVPENFTGVIRQTRPELVVFVDTLDFGGRPGETVLAAPSTLTEDRFSTHRPSLGLVMDFVAKETGAEVRLLGVQPRSIELATAMTPEVEQTLNNLVDLFTHLAQTV